VYQALLEARERKPDVPVLPEPTTDFVFIRYIGHPRIELNAGLLDEWSEFLVSQLRRRAQAYVICHSPDNLTAPLLCRELHGRVAAKLSIPPLPWDDADRSTFEQEPLL
jgi:uncharacterized protein YecE (DUF72 family)